MIIQEVMEVILTKKRTHFYIARLSIESMNNTDKCIESKKVDKWAFYLGAILPDLSMTQFLHPHYYERSSEYVFNKLIKIACKPTKNLADIVRLGEMVHYLSDFCCYAHVGGGIGCISEHLFYEKRIHQFVKNHYSDLQWTIDCNSFDSRTADNVIEQVKDELIDYYNKTPGYQLDIMKSVKIAAMIYYGILFRYSDNRNTGTDLEACTTEIEQF
jgi:hypothetical protein